MPKKLTPKSTPKSLVALSKSYWRTVGELNRLVHAARQAVPESKHPASGTVDDWAFQIRALGEDRRACYAQRDRARIDLEVERKKVADLMRQNEIRTGRYEALWQAAQEKRGLCTGCRDRDVLLRNENENYRHASDEALDLKRQLFEEKQKTARIAARLNGFLERFRDFVAAVREDDSKTTWALYGASKPEPPEGQATKPA
jgi:hypothetical protein